MQSVVRNYDTDGEKIRTRNGRTIIMTDLPCHTQTEGGIKNCPIFRGMTDLQLQSIIEKMHEHHYEKDTTILEEGRETQCLWFITDGCCEVVRKGVSQTHHFTELTSGAIFGEMSFIDPAPHSATVRADANVTVLSLTRDAFDELDAETAQILIRNIAHILTQRLRAMDNWMSEVMDRPACAKAKEEWQEFRSKLFTPVWL